MSLYKRKDSPFWWVKIAHGGQVVQRSTGTAERKQAQAYHDKLSASLWEQERLGVEPRRTWKEAVVRHLEETSHKASIAADKTHLRWLDSHLADVELEAIDRETVERITAARRAEGVANATVNRTLEVLRAILRKAAQEWDWLARVPRIRMLPEPKRRVRWLTREQAETLMTALPAHLAAMVRFSLQTGLRRANVTGLAWEQVDIARQMLWVAADQTKNRQALGIPLSDEAIAVLRAQQGKHDRYVFTFRGKPVRQVNTKAWRNALRSAGIENFRWHDLRHTWASWHVQAGTSLHALQELGGWQSAEMVRRYAHLSTEHLAQYAARLSRAQPAAKESAEVATI
jgi:integrase